MSVLRVLFVEDNPDDVELMKRELKRLNGFDLFTQRVDTEQGFREALNQLPWDYVVCDFSMPSFDAIKALEILDVFRLDTLPFILVSGKITQEQSSQVLRNRRVSEFVSKEDLHKLGPIFHRELRAAEMHEWAFGIIARALEIRDIETAGHSQRVTAMAVDLARAMGISEALIVHIRRGALLHDIGKMGISDSILLKPGPLTPDERVNMQRHPVIAYKLLYSDEDQRNYLKHALDIPHYHHEHWDGTGYPRGLKGEEIPLAARIFSVVDVYDALTTDRPYRKAWMQAETLEWLQRQREVLFDPVVVNVFVKMMQVKQ